MQRRITHTFQCEPSTYWKNFFDPEYGHQLFVGRLRFERWDIVQTTETADGFRRVIEAVPRVGDLPGPIKALIRNGTGYREEGEYFRSRGCYHTKIISASLGERLDFHGDMIVEDLGDGRCVRHYDCTAVAHVRLIGSMLEKRLLDDVEKSYGKAAEFTQQWLAEHGST